MRVLLDTQCWLWMRTEPDRLSRRVRKLVSNPATRLVVSTASCWEIAIKYAIGRLSLPAPPADYIPRIVAEDAIALLDIGLTHVLHVAVLPHHHGDPFDRLLIAQALIERLPVVTSDPRFSDYGVDVVDV